MARVRMPRLCRRGTPSRALPAAPRRRETASRGAHRLRKARDPRSRASVVFQPRPPLTPASRAPLHRAHRLVALASGRRPVSDGGFTGVRLPRTRARRARPPAPRPVETSSKNERKPSSRRFRASSCIPRRISLRSIERSSTPLHHRVSTGRAPGGAQRAPGPFPGVRGGCAHAAPPRRARRRQSRQPQRLARERVGRRHGPLRRRRGRRQARGHPRRDDVPGGRAAVAGPRGARRERGGGCRPKRAAGFGSAFAARSRSPRRRRAPEEVRARRGAF